MSWSIGLGHYTSPHYIPVWRKGGTSLRALPRSTELCWSLQLLPINRQLPCWFCLDIWDPDLCLHCLLEMTISMSFRDLKYNMTHPYYSWPCSWFFTHENIASLPIIFVNHHLPSCLSQKPGHYSRHFPFSFYSQSIHVNYILLLYYIPIQKFDDAFSTMELLMTPPLIPTR